MLIYQDGKLYIEKGKSLVGVDIDSGKVSETKEKATRKKSSRVVTLSDVRLKFNITEENPYKFPVTKKKVTKGAKKDESTNNTKKSTGKSKRK